MPKSLQMPCQTPLEAMAQGDAYLAEPTYPEVYYWLWLAEVLAPASVHAGPLLDAFGDAAAAYYARESAQFQTIVGKVVAARVVNQQIDPAACAACLAVYEALGVSIVTPADIIYPSTLARIPDLPLVLYCTGNLAALSAPVMVGMVGTRRPSAYGAEIAVRFGTAFARGGAVIVSGLAEGLDAAGHHAAVAEQATTIGVMGTPIHKTFPAANAALRKEIEALGGLIITEYPIGFASGKTRSSFLQRNRIIAALSDALVVVEAREKSGTMSTVAHAERYGTPIFAVPGSVFSALSEGTNKLLREGRAKMLLESSDVLYPLGLTEDAPKRCATPTAAPAKQLLSAEAQAVLACVSATPVGVGALVSKSGLAMGAVLSALTSLEIAGHVVALPGRQYIAK